MYKGDSLKNYARIGFVSNIGLYFIKEPPKMKNHLCRGGYQPPATFLVLSGWMNGKKCCKIVRIRRKRPHFSQMVLHGRLVASPTEGQVVVLPFILYLNPINAPLTA